VFKRFIGVVWVFLIVFSVQWAIAAPKDEVPVKERCPVCGMFVAKYKPWLCQLHFADEEVVMFDGVKDLMAYYFQPEQYGGKPKAEIRDVYVKDYYSQKWIDGKKAFYVVGSDVYGPMGHELIPFDSMPAAKNFQMDHHGKEIITFQDITFERINMMRVGMTMKGQ
jgi:copper chaperone NosL